MYFTRGGVSSVLRRIWCRIFEHRPRRHRFDSSRFGAFTRCGRCNQLLARGYFGWQRADASDERQFKRALVKRDSELAAKSAEGNLSPKDMEKFMLPWGND